MLSLLVYSTPALLLLTSHAATQRAATRAAGGATIRLAAGEEIFGNPGWAVVAQELDKLPAFTVSNEQGQPLQYEIEPGKPVGMFHANIIDAKKELADARTQYPDLGLDLIPVGLGNAYKLSCEGKALLIPDSREQASAKGPNGEAFPADALPLFGCLELSQQGENGEPCMPLFMTAQDAQDAIAQASAYEEQQTGEKPDLKIMVLSLERAVELLITVKGDTPSFRFVPPTSSLLFIQNYLKEN